MMPPVPSKEFAQFISDLQLLEQRAHNLRMHRAGHLINNAIKFCGWEQAERRIGEKIGKAAKAVKKSRTK